MCALQCCSLDWGVEAHSSRTVRLGFYRSCGGAGAQAGAGHPRGGTKNDAREYTYSPMRTGDSTREQRSRVDHQIGLNIIRSEASIQFIKAKKTPWNLNKDYLNTVFPVNYTFITTNHSHFMTFVRVVPRSRSFREKNKNQTGLWMEMRQEQDAITLKERASKFFQFSKMK